MVWLVKIRNCRLIHMEGVLYMDCMVLSDEKAGRGGRRLSLPKYYQKTCRHSLRKRWESRISLPICRHVMHRQNQRLYLFFLSEFHLRHIISGN